MDAMHWMSYELLALISGGLIAILENKKSGSAICTSAEHVLDSNSYFFVSANGSSNASFILA